MLFHVSAMHAHNYLFFADPYTYIFLHIQNTQFDIIKQGIEGEEGMENNFMFVISDNII